MHKAPKIPKSPPKRKKPARRTSSGIIDKGTSESSKVQEDPASYAAPKKPDPRNTLNDLNATEWIPETISVWNQRGLGAGHPDAVIERQHPAPFSFTDVSRLIRFFTKRGGKVLDPFSGVGSTLKACALEGRKGIGFELNPHYAALAQQRLTSEVKDLLCSVDDQEICIGDSRELARELPPESLDFIVTSPPYWNILHKEDHKAIRERKNHDLDTRYSDDTRDLGNIHDYDAFLADLATILGLCTRALKIKKYMAVIVSDFREKSKFVMFHADLTRSLAPYNLELRGLNVLYQRHKKVFPYGYPFAFVPNIHHQFILILQKVAPIKDK
jgi:DNA modification methylase